MRKLLLSLLIFVITIHIGTAQTIEPFKQGDRVVFLGNSITDYGHYHSYIWLYYMTHFPYKRIDIFNAGIKGHTAGQMYKRLDSDVLNRDPTVIALTFGMNDTGYLEFLKPNADALAQKNIELSRTNYLLIEKRLKDLPQVKKIIMSSPPYDEHAKIKLITFPKKQEAMLKITDFQKKSTVANNWGFIDFNGDIETILNREQKKDSTFTLTSGDRVHPDVNGHLVMAYIFLKAQGFAGHDVADIKIDAVHKKTVKHLNCTISNLMVRPGSIKFTYLAKSLPFPLDTAHLTVLGLEKHTETDALKLVPFIKDFDSEILAVKGLKNMAYLLKIDGVEIGEWPAKAFGDGINLAEQTNTPQYQQALKIMRLNEKRWRLERNLRDYAWMQYDFFAPKGLLFADNQAALDTLIKDVPGSYNPFLDVKFYRQAMLKSTRDDWQNQINSLVNEIYADNKPQKHIIEITAK